ncbi:MAG: hypothetical protein ACP5HQ_02325 [Thermoprotei archaeon]
MSKDKLFYQLQDYMLLRTSLEKVKIKLEGTRSPPWGLIEEELQGLFAKGKNDPHLTSVVEPLRQAVDERDKDEALKAVNEAITSIDKKIREIYSMLRA